jgi:hypothetical protein
MIPGFAVVAVLAAVTAGPDYLAWRPLLAQELAERDVRDPEDLYKFLHQGVMGPGHAGADSAHLRVWLDREWDEMPAAADTAAAAVPRPPLLTPLRPDGRLVRVDLMRLRDLAGDDAAAARGLLAAAQTRTAAVWSGDTAIFAGLWRAAAADTALWAGRLDPDSLAVLTRETAAAGWPAVHHGDAYRERWQPHYRVVDPALLPPEWLP